jgi:molybdenum cofactor cytidylyltransferase
MQLWEALEARKGAVISFVGAGGKTTAMYRLAGELAHQGWRVVTTTTTKIRPPSSTQTGALIVEGDAAQSVRLVEKALRREQIITLASERLEAENKLQGIQPDVVSALAERADAVIVEADGARGLSLKAPAAYEPVVPSATTIIVPVVGIDVVGRQIAAGTVHRPQLVAELTGVPQGEIVTASLLATVLVHGRGSLKGVPTQSRVAPLINKVDDATALAAAREVARAVKGHRALWRVLIGTAVKDDPILECWRRVSAVVLAAGGSTRYGVPKQLLDIGGSTMLEHVLHVLDATSVDEVVVVLGRGAAQVASCVPSGCKTVWNADWRAGISSSIQAGLDAVDCSSEAAMFVLADQPRISSEAMERILQGYYGSTKPIVAPVYEGLRGNPVLFDRRLFPALAQLRGDVGGRQVMDRIRDQVLTVEMPIPDVFVDVDTPEDYANLIGKKAN